MKHSFPFLFPIKGGLKNDLTDNKNLAVIPSCTDTIRAPDDRRTVTVNIISADCGIETILAGWLILELIRSTWLQGLNLATSSNKLLEERPHLKNNRYYKAWRRRELMKNNPICTS
jgi:hypothetical protein